VVQINQSRHAVDRASGATPIFLDPGSLGLHAEEWTRHWEYQRASAVYRIPESNKTLEIEDKCVGQG